MVLFLTVPSAAQNELPVRLSLTYVDVKPEMDTAFQDLLRTHWLPAAEKSGLEFIAAGRAGSFGDAYQYIFVAPIRKFAEYDGKPPVMAVMAPEDYAVPPPAPAALRNRRAHHRHDASSGTELRQRERRPVQTRRHA